MLVHSPAGHVAVGSPFDAQAYALPNTGTSGFGRVQALLDLEAAKKAAAAPAAPARQQSAVIAKEAEPANPAPAAPPAAASYPSTHRSADHTPVSSPAPPRAPDVPHHASGLYSSAESAAIYAPVVDAFNEDGPWLQRTQRSLASTQRAAPRPASACVRPGTSPARGRCADLTVVPGEVIRPGEHRISRPSTAQARQRRSPSRCKAVQATRPATSSGHAGNGAAKLRRKAGRKSATPARPVSPALSAASPSTLDVKAAAAAAKATLVAGKQQAEASRSPHRTARTGASGLSDIFGKPPAGAAKSSLSSTPAVSRAPSTPAAATSAAASSAATAVVPSGASLDAGAFLQSTTQPAGAAERDAGAFLQSFGSSDRGTWPAAALPLAARPSSAASSSSRRRKRQPVTAERLEEIEKELRLRVEEHTPTYERGQTVLLKVFRAFDPDARQSIPSGALRKVLEVFDIKASEAEARAITASSPRPPDAVDLHELYYQMFTQRLFVRHKVPRQKTGAAEPSVESPLRLSSQRLDASEAPDASSKAFIDELLAAYDLAEGRPVAVQQASAEATAAGVLATALVTPLERKLEGATIGWQALALGELTDGLSWALDEAAGSGGGGANALLVERRTFIDAACRAVASGLVACTASDWCGALELRAADGEAEYRDAMARVVESARRLWEADPHLEASEWEELERRYSAPALGNAAQLGTLVVVLRRCAARCAAARVAIRQRRKLLAHAESAIAQLVPPGEGNSASQQSRTKRAWTGIDSKLRASLLAQLRSLLSLLRHSRVTVVEAILSWRAMYRDPLPFLWDGRNYLLSMQEEHVTISRQLHEELQQLAGRAAAPVDAEREAAARLAVESEERVQATREQQRVRGWLAPRRRKHPSTAPPARLLRWQPVNESALVSELRPPSWNDEWRHYYFQATN